jgi:Kef-type K+ transport system membrane component KefB
MTEKRWGHRNFTDNIEPLPLRRLVIALTLSVAGLVYGILNLTKLLDHRDSHVIILLGFCAVNWAVGGLSSVDRFSTVRHRVDERWPYLLVSLAALYLMLLGISERHHWLIWQAQRAQDYSLAALLLISFAILPPRLWHQCKLALARHRQHRLHADTA